MRTEIELKKQNTVKETNYKKVIVKKPCRSCGDPCWNNSNYCWECYKYQHFESR